MQQRDVWSKTSIGCSSLQKSKLEYEKDFFSRGDIVKIISQLKTHVSTVYGLK
jgi:hypothetical protein